MADVLDALARGLAVLPLCNRYHVGVGRVHAKRCKNPGKVPHFPDRPGDMTWAEYQGRVATEAEVRNWWRLDPGLNLGVALGVTASRLPVVAVDVDHALGHAKLLEASGGDLPPTWEYDTGRPDAFRLVYLLPPGRTAATVPFLDPATGKEPLKLMAGGTQIVWPPSVHPTGAAYRWRPGRSPADLPPAPVPGWWPAARPSARRPAGGGAGEELVWTEPGRNSALTRLAGAARRQGAGAAALAALLAEANDHQCDPPLGDDELAKIVASVLRYGPSPDPVVRMVIPAGGVGVTLGKGVARG